MKKILLGVLLLVGFCPLQAQYREVNALLDRLEEKKGMNQNLKEVRIDDIKFVRVKDFEDHTERNFIIIKGTAATYVEIFDDKKTGKSTSNVFTGDIVRTQHNIISLRADKLENEKIPLPVTKNLLITKQKNILYLVDINTRERWVEENSVNKK